MRRLRVFYTADAMHTINQYVTVFLFCSYRIAALRYFGMVDTGVRSPLGAPGLRCEYHVILPMV